MSAHDLFVGVRPPLAIDRKEVVFWRPSKTSGCEMSPAFLSIDQVSSHCSTLGHCARLVLASECSGLQLPCDHERPLGTGLLALPWSSPADVLSAVFVYAEHHPPTCPKQSALRLSLQEPLAQPSPASLSASSSLRAPRVAAGHLGRFKSGFVVFASFLFRIRLALDVDNANDTSSAPTDNQ